MHRDDPAAMSIDERLDEVASLLGIGFLRVKRVAWRMQANAEGGLTERAPGGRQLDLRRVC